MTVDAARQFDFAERVITQVVGLSSGILALSLTFADKWGQLIHGKQQWLLRGSWILMVLSLAAGLLCLLRLTDLARIGVGDIGDLGLRIPWLVQLIAFLLGLGLMFWLGMTIL